jgi:hypothetical protein
METEEHYLSLYSALYNAITDHELVGDLLKHPEFRHKAGQICSEIAGAAGGEDLLQEACLRVLESADDLNPDSIRGEGEFFAWFSRLVRCVHVSRVLSAATANNCTDMAARWPDSSADVPPDDMGRFLAHADECLYHTRILRAEDEELSAAFGRARGLNSRGRILLGDELKARIDDHRRRSQKWREAALKKGEMYGQVALFNDDRKVASCGWFSDFSNHQSRHELDPDAGLQIRGLSSSDPDEDVLLGFYELAGVRHGGREKELKLDNGYTICLKVEELGGNNFEINFRCVETKTLEANRAAAGADAGVIKDGASGDDPLSNSPRSPESSVLLPTGVPVSRESAGWWPLPRSLQAAGAFALLLIVAVPCFQLGRTLGRREGSADMGRLPSRLEAAEINPLLRIEPLKASGEDSQPRRTTLPEPRQDAGASPPAPRSKQEQMQGTRALPEDPLILIAPSRLLMEQMQGASALPEDLTREDEGRISHNDKPEVLLKMLDSHGFDRSFSGNMNNDEADYRRFPSSGPEIQELYMALPAVSDPNLIAAWSIPPGTKLSNAVTDRRPETPAPTPMVSYEDRGLSAANQMVNVSTNGRQHSTNNPVLHIATNDVLANKLYKALREQSLRVEPAAEQNPEKARFTVTWNVSISSESGLKVVVMLYVNISEEGVTKFAERRSYKGVGHSLNAAYDDAVEQAVEPVVTWLRNKNRERLSASADEIGGQEQPVAALPEVKANGEDGSGAEVGAEGVEQNASRQVKDGCNKE